MASLRPPFTEQSMQGLCRKVMKGQYPPIPKTYSKDLSTIIAQLLRVKPDERPSCEQIMHYPSFNEHLPNEIEEELNLQMLNTIKLPRNIKMLNGKLPKSQYEDASREASQRKSVSPPSHNISVNA